MHYALVAAYIVAVCVGPLLFYYSTHFPFVLSGFHIFLLAWVAQRILERMQPLLRQLHRREPTIADAGPPPA